MYTTEDGLTKIETTFDEDTIWLYIDQMAELFQRNRSVIGKHARNIFKKWELDKNSVWAKFAYTATDGKKYNVDCYNLDVIISVGYRVKSLHGTQFRIWAMGILKEYMKKGFALNDDQLKFSVQLLFFFKNFFPQKVKHMPHVIITDITKESTKLYIHPIPVNEIKY